MMMQVLDAVMRYSDRAAGEDSEAAGQQVEVLHWAAAIDDTGQPQPALPHFAAQTWVSQSSMQQAIMTMRMSQLGQHLRKQYDDIASNY